MVDYLENVGRIENLIPTNKIQQASAESSREMAVLFDFLRGKNILQEDVRAELLRQARELLAEYSSGDAGRRFAELILFLISGPSQLSDHRKEIIKELCKVGYERPSPATYLGEFVSLHLDSPDLLKYVLVNFKRMNWEFYSRLKETGYENADKTTIQDNKILVYGFSRAVAELLSCMKIKKGYDFTVFSYMASSSARRKDPKILVEFLYDVSKGAIKPEPVDREGALDLIANNEVGLFLMGCVAVVLDQGQVQYLNPRDVVALTAAIGEKHVPTGMVTGAFKIWSRDHYEAYKLNSSPEVQSENPAIHTPVTWTLTEHGLFTDEEHLQRRYADCFAGTPIPMSGVWPFDYLSESYRASIEQLYMPGGTLLAAEARKFFMAKRLGWLGDHRNKYAAIVKIGEEFEYDFDEDSVKLWKRAQRQYPRSYIFIEKVEGPSGVEDETELGSD